VCFGLLNYFFPLLPLLRPLFQLLIPIFVKSFLTSSSHLALGLPFGLVAYGFHLYEGRGLVEVQNPHPPEIPKALENHAKLKPIVKTVKNC
jgi:hypothetical protein